MISGSIPRRYAKALLSIGIETGEFERYGAEITQLAAQLEDSQLSDTLENPSYPKSKRKAILEEIIARLSPSPTVRSFVLLLMDRGRQGFLTSICRQYQLLADEHAGRVRARVVSAQPLEPSGAARLKRAIEQRTGKQVILEQNTDPSLIAGIVTQIGSIIYDGSIRTSLNQLKESLLQGQL